MAQTLATADDAALAGPPARTRLRQLSVPAQAALIAGGLLLIWWIVKFWPAAIAPTDTLPGIPGDGWGGTSIWQMLADERLNPFAPGRIMAYNAPEGGLVAWQVNIQQWPSTLFHYGVTRLTGDADAAMNWYLAIAAIGNAVAMAWFTARFVVRDRWIAVIAGVAFAFQPLIIVKLPDHTAFGHMWPLILLVGTVLIAWERPSWKTTAIAGATAFVAMSWSGYHLLFAGVLFAFVLAAGTLVQLRRDTWRTTLWTSVRIAFFAGVGLLAVAITLRVVGQGQDPVQAIRQNGLDSLYTYSARWYEYLLPPATSQLFGDITRPYLETRLHASNHAEQTLYQGVTVMLFALAGVAWLLFRRLREAERPSIVPTRTSLLWVIGPGVVLVAGICSLPPTVNPFGMSVPTPSRVIFDFVTSWRVYARFALVVGIGMVILAALGLRYLAGDGKRRVAVLLLASVAIPLDLWLETPPAQPHTNQSPEAAAVLKAQPPGIAAIYPLSRGEYDWYGSLYNQQFFGRPILNGFDDSPQEARAASMQDLTKRETVQRLSALGVRYVLMLWRPMQSSEAPLPARPHPSMSLVAESKWFGTQADIYRVPADAGAYASVGAGFDPPSAGTTSTRWATGDDGTIDLGGSCAGPCEGVVRLDMRSFGRQKITAKLDGKPVPITANGKRVMTYDLPDRQVVEIPVRFEKAATLTIHSERGAIPIKQLIPDSTELGSVSFAVSRARFAERPTR